MHRFAYDDGDEDNTDHDDDDKYVGRITIKANADTRIINSHSRPFTHSLIRSINQSTKQHPLTYRTHARTHAHNCNKLMKYAVGFRLAEKGSEQQNQAKLMFINSY